MSNFLDVTLTKYAMLEGLDGVRAPRLRCLFSVSGLRGGYIGKFVKKSSCAPPDFPSAVEILVSETREIQGLSKTRYIANQEI